MTIYGLLSHCYSASSSGADYIIGHSAVVFRVSMFFRVFCVLLTLCVVVFFSDILLIYSAV